MADLSIHRVRSVKVKVGEPQSDIANRLYCVTHIVIETEDEAEHKIILFSDRCDSQTHSKKEEGRKTQQFVYPFVEMERPSVSESDE